MKTKYDSPFLHVVSIQLVFILLFSLLYYSILHQFTSNIKHHQLDYLDCVSLSTTIQAGIGLTDMQPQSHLSIMFTTIHQIVVILSAVYIVFTFTMDT
jgi:hypothetical protein